MSKRPTTYFWREVKWLDDYPEVKDHDCDSLRDARYHLNLLSKAGRYGAIGKRKNITDATPEGDPRGILWEYETVILEEN